MSPASKLVNADDFHNIALEVLNNNGRLRFQAMGESMLPFICPGDVLFIEPIPPALLQIGDIILYHRNGAFHTVHRLVRKENKQGRVWLTTQGDNLPVRDSPICEDQVLGRVVALKRRGHELVPGRGWGWQVNRLVRYLRWHSPHRFIRAMVWRKM